MTEREVLKLALEALEEVVKWYQVRDKHDEPMPVHNQNPEIKAAIEAITAIKEVLAQPVIDKSAATRIATSLGWEPKRTWVGLKDDDLWALWNGEYGVDLPEYFNAFKGAARVVEAKLKEKNT